MHAVHGFWPVEESVDLANGPPGGGELAKGGCFICLELTVIRSTVLRQRGEKD